jgi:hypothetical protein
MAESNRERWRELCAAAAEEPDSDKLLFLVSQILDAFESPQEFDRPQERILSSDSLEPCS